MAEIPPLIDNTSESVARYLRYLQRDVEFSQQLLAYMVEDRRVIHRERTNEGKHLIIFKEGDLVMGRVAVQIK